MVKNYILALLFVLTCSLTLSAQYEFTARLAGVPYGNVRQLVTNGSIISQFDNEGRITSCRSGVDEFRYSWNGNIVTITGYHDGVSQGSESYRIVTNTSSEMVIEDNAGSRMTYRFNNDGLVVNQTVEFYGQKMETHYLYNGSDKFPYRMTMSNGQGTVSTELGNYDADLQGNWIRCTLTMNEQSQTVNREILYY